MENNNRKAMLAKVHIAKSQLGLKDFDYRFLLEHLFDVHSSAQLSDVELDKLLRHLETVGFVPTDKDGNPRPRPKQRTSSPDIKPNNGAPGCQKLIDKIHALIVNIGKLEKRYLPWSYAESILRRQGGGEFLNWATEEALTKVVAALSTRLRVLRSRQEKAA
jgi:phage gp16-like protein